MKPILLLLTLSLVYTAGVLTHGFWVGHESGPVYLPTMDSGMVPLTPSITKVSGQEGRGTREILATPASEGTLRVAPGIIRALVLRKGFNEKTLQRMGLGPAEIENVMRVKTQAEEAFAQLELRHSKEVKDARGDFVEISPFPEDQKKWMTGVTNDLRAFIPDDRAAVITEMIAPMNNDEELGRYRREVFVTGSPDQPKSMRIQEQTFNEQGQLIDTDYMAIGNEVPARWKHLLDFSGK